jgi:Holliday junction resolvase
VKTVNRKAKGRRLEWAVKKLYQDSGHFVARQAASRFPDLIVLRKGEDPTFIECKSGKGNISMDERAEGKRIAEMTGGRFIVARKKDRGEIEFELIT